MILLMGIKMSLTKNPMNPITTKPTAVRKATFENSLRSGLWQRLTRRTLSLEKSLNGSKTESSTSIDDDLLERLSWEFFGLVWIILGRKEIFAQNLMVSVEFLRWLFTCLHEREGRRKKLQIAIGCVRNKDVYQPMTFFHVHNMLLFSSKLFLISFCHWVLSECLTAVFF